MDRSTASLRYWSSGNDPGRGQGPLEQRQVGQIGTGQSLGDAGQRLAARFTLIGLSARANA
jgi:hypothetical protein